MGFLLVSPGREFVLIDKQEVRNPVVHVTGTIALRRLAARKARARVPARSLERRDRLKVMKTGDSSSALLS
jgi:hypothetical protein